MSSDEARVKFADELLGALGLKSVTTKSVAEADDVVEDWSKTAFVGRAYYSTKNRDVLLSVLDDDPALQTLAQLGERLSALSGDEAGEEVRAILAAVGQVADSSANSSLTEFVRESSDA